MTEKLLTFPSPPPQPTYPDSGDGVNRSKFNFFPVQHQHNLTPPTVFVPGHHARIQEFFVRGGARLLNLFYSLKGGPMVLLHTFQGGPTFSRDGGPIETHITITCDFPGGSGPPNPPPPPPPPPLWICTWTLWHFGTNRLRRACVFLS